MTEGRWILVSNRLPVARDPVTKALGRSSGGLVSAILGIESQPSTLWVGAVPPDISETDWRTLGPSDERYRSFVPVFVDEATYDRYYNGLSNGALWPLLHYESNLVDFKWEDWSAYVEVNERFAKAVAEVATPEDLVWIHDYQLFLVPRFLKRLNPELRVGFFLHVPFPSSEVFRQLPVRREILSSLLEADLVGFHEHSYLRHFCTSLALILGIDSSLLHVRLPGRKVRLGVFPVSIDSKRIARTAASPEVARLIQSHRRKQHYDYLVLGVDRLDYTKGLELKLLAFREMLRDRPELRGRVSLIQIAVPTRTGVPEYSRLKRHIEELVGEINGEFGRPNSVPVQYLYTSVSFEELLALYRMANALLITSKRDGMNLVALEYLAAQNPKNPGTVLLSEFAGARSNLSHVIPINPWDALGTGRALAAALALKKTDRAARHGRMLDYLHRYDATKWAHSFFKALSKAEPARAPGEPVEIEASEEGVSLPAPLRKGLPGARALVVTDYDGTLVPIEDDPAAARLTPDRYERVKALAERPGVKLLVVSGRPRRFLMEQFRGLPVALAAEHGALFLDDARGGRWRSLVNTDRSSWYAPARQILGDYASRVPGSFIEEKEYALVWHYRQSPPEFADYLAKKLKEELEIGLANLPVTILAGKKVVEARAVEANKGTFARWFLESRRREHWDVIVALGDDRTDEELFTAMPEASFTIKIGEGETRARYRLTGQDRLLALLEAIGREAGRVTTGRAEEPAERREPCAPLAGGKESLSALGPAGREEP